MGNRIGNITAIIALAMTFFSCVSTHDRQITTQEIGTLSLIGQVSTEFTSFQFLNIRNNNRLRTQAHRLLLDEARRQHGLGVDIRNITISGRGSGWQVAWIAGVGGSLGLAANAIDGFVGDGISALLWASGFAVPAIMGNFQRVTATGDIVLLSNEPMIPQVGQQRFVDRITHQSLNAAIDRAAETLIAELPANATIAILNINAANISDAEFTIDMLDFRFVQSRRFMMVDRHRLTEILREQELHLSGFVDDNSAVSIGNMLGASIVITGNVASNRLVLRVLDVQTAQIITMALELF